MRQQGTAINRSLRVRGFQAAAKRHERRDGANARAARHQAGGETDFEDVGHMSHTNTCHIARRCHNSALELVLLCRTRYRVPPLARDCTSEPFHRRVTV